MSSYNIESPGPGGSETERDFASPEAARDAAITMLGEYLQHHPDFAYQKHWRVDVRDHSRRLLMHVMVATVDAPPPINFRSFED